jgi:DNA repair protein RadC
MKPDGIIESEDLTRGIAVHPSGSSRWSHLQPLAETGTVTPGEILEILLHFGRSADIAASLAARVLSQFGSLSGAVAADPARISDVLDGDRASVVLLKAVDAAVRAILREPLEERPVIHSASALMDYLAVTMRNEPTEITRILYLDRKNGLIKDEIQQRGTVDYTPIYPREVVKRVAELGACAIILVHNHLTADPTPSLEDIMMTCQVAAALATIGVVLHDHIIISRTQEVSFRKLKLLPCAAARSSGSRRAVSRARAKP